MIVGTTVPTSLAGTVIPASLVVSGVPTIVLGIIVPTGGRNYRLIWGIFLILNLFC